MSRRRRIYDNQDEQVSYCNNEYSDVIAMGENFCMEDYREVESALQRITDYRNGLALDISRRMNNGFEMTKPQLSYLESYSRQIDVLQEVLDSFDIEGERQ